MRFRPHRGLFLLGFQDFSCTKFWYNSYVKKDIQNAPATKGDIDVLRKETQEDLELMGGNLTFEIEAAKQENKESIDANTNRLSKLEELVVEMKKSVDLNTEATTMLTNEFKEIKHIEFQVYNHENRITKLEKAR